MPLFMRIRDAWPDLHPVIFAIALEVLYRHELEIANRWFELGWIDAAERAVYVERGGVLRLIGLSGEARP